MCELHTAYYIAPYNAADYHSQDIQRAVIPVESDHRKAETKSDRWLQIHRGSLETLTAGPSTASYLRVGWDDPSKKKLLALALNNTCPAHEIMHRMGKKNNSMVRLYQLNELW
jgi:hypothetical protein